MLELLTGTGLATAAGFNAYIPLVLMGLTARMEWIHLPAGWAWLENGWVLVIIGVLLVIDFVADKVPAVDTVNNVVQTAVRPTSGGIVFSGGVGTETVAIDDPSSFFENGAWIPVAIGVVIALLISLGKSVLRVIANFVTGGAAAPVLSATEDSASVTLVVFALVAPLLVLVLLVLLALGFVTLMKRNSRRRREKIEGAAGTAALTG